MGKVITGSADERAGAILRGRVESASGALTQAADVAAISYEVWDILASPIVRIGDATTVDAADVIFDIAQPWELDNVGYNFSLVLPAALLPAKSIYRIDIKVAPAAGEVCYLKFELSTIVTYFGRMSPLEG